MPDRLRSLLITFVLVGTLLVVGCAATTTTTLDEEVLVNQLPMASYHRLVVADFTLQRELFTDRPADRMTSRDRRYAALPQRLAESMQRYLCSYRIYREVTRGATTAGPRTLLLTGRFIRVGRFRLSVEGRLLDGATGREVVYFRQTLWDVLDTTDRIGELGREIASFIDRIQYR